MAVHQKGANGLIAEYRCAVSLNAHLLEAGYSVTSSQSDLDRELAAVVERVGNELSPGQLRRAYAQGDALAEYVQQRLDQAPESLGLILEAPLGAHRIAVLPVGHQTNSGDPRDLLIMLENGDRRVELPISLKAYRGTSSSLGSKSARASLARMFLGSESVPDEEFRTFFEAPGDEFLDLLTDFKQVAATFYASPAGVAFVDAYERRKGTRKVNNPLRRKELGAFFVGERGFKPEHRFADLYVKMFNLGKTKADVHGAGSTAFVAAMNFILGNPAMLVLDAIAGDDGTVHSIVNSLEHPTYRALNLALRPGNDFRLTHKPNSSMVRVEIDVERDVFRNLSLAIWKDATIQYKLDTKKR